MNEEDKKRKQERVGDRCARADPQNFSTPHLLCLLWCSNMQSGTRVLGLWCVLLAYVVVVNGQDEEHSFFQRCYDEKRSACFQTCPEGYAWSVHCVSLSCSVHLECVRVCVCCTLELCTAWLVMITGVLLFLDTKQSEESNTHLVKLRAYRTRTTSVQSRTGTEVRMLPHAHTRTTHTHTHRTHAYKHPWGITHMAHIAIRWSAHVSAFWKMANEKSGSHRRGCLFPLLHSFYHCIHVSVTWCAYGVWRVACAMCIIFVFSNCYLSLYLWQFDVLVLPPWSDCSERPEWWQKQRCQQ